MIKKNYITTNQIIVLSLHFRLRRSGQPSLVSRSSSHKSFPSPQGSFDDVTDEDDEEDEFSCEGKPDEKPENKSEESQAQESGKTE